MHAPLVSLRPRLRRGFGLIDVSLGIIAGLGLLVGAVILFQQVTTNNAVSGVTRNLLTISTEIRSAARNAPNFETISDATGGATSGMIDLAGLGLEPALFNNPNAFAVGSGQEFAVTFTGLSGRACTRIAVTPGNLGANVVSADCHVPQFNPTLVVVYGR